MTAKELRKALKGIPDNTPIYIRDHDHDTYETNSKARNAELLNQVDMGQPDELDECYRIEGDYFVISA